MRSTSAKVTLLDSLSRFFASDAGRRAVAYSGGRDSGVLLWAMVQICGPDRVTAVYVDHGWRSVPERETEQWLVQDWCRVLGVELVTFGPPTPVVRTEAGARDHRYRCFQSFLADRPGVSLSLAHHADDQAETILMRLLKGRSWQGLGGMPSRRGAYRRPLLALRSSLLAEVATEQGILFHEDSSNTDVRLARNFLRRKVIPLVLQRFPRATEALGEFGEVWSQTSGDRAPHPDWVQGDGGYRISAPLWDQWSSLERQAQLLAVVSRCRGSSVMTRRFLEAVTVDGRRGDARGGGWTWSRTGAEVFWGTVAREPRKEYFILAMRDRQYDVGLYRMCWSAETPGSLEVPGVDSGLPWVWRSTLPGMRISSADNADWGREVRHKRLGSLDPGRCALILQGGLLRAVVDPLGNRIVWAESEPGKLHKPGIFVTLVTVTPISTE